MAARMTITEAKEVATVVSCSTTVDMRIFPAIAADLDGSRYLIGEIVVLLHHPATGDPLHTAKGWAVPVLANGDPDPKGLPVFRVLPAGVANPFITLAVRHQESVK